MEAKINVSGSIVVRDVDDDDINDDDYDIDDYYFSGLNFNKALKKAEYFTLFDFIAPGYINTA